MSLSRKLRPLAFSLALLVLSVGFARADRFTWDGGGLDDKLITAKNWEGNIKPPNDGSAEFIFSGNVRTKPDAATVWQLYRIIYPNGDPNAFALSGSELIISTGGILNGSLQTQTISNDLTLVDHPLFTNSHLWSNDPGNLELQGDIDMQSEIVEVYGSGQTRLYGNVTGVNGRLRVGSPTMFSTPGTLVLSGTINVDVDTNIGTLVIDTNQPQPPFSTLSFADGTSFRSAGIQDITQAFLLNGDVTYDGSGQLRSEQTIMGSGNLIIDGAATAILGLGPSNNFIPFSGQVSIEQGQLELNGNGSIAQLRGTVIVGDFKSTAQTAVLRSSTPGVLASGIPMTVNSDGLADLTGALQFSELNLYGGALVSTGSVDAEPIKAGISARTALLDAAWSMPLIGLDYDLIVSNGAANPDIQLLQGCEGPGTLRVSGGGQVELYGDPALGPMAINVMAGELVLDRPRGATMLTTAGASNATIRTRAIEQFGSACQVNLLSGSTLDIGQYLEHIGRLNIVDAQIMGLSGALTLHQDMDVFGTVDIEPFLQLAPNFFAFKLFSSAILTTGTVSGINMRLTGEGGSMSSEEIDGNFTVSVGTLRFSGFLDGDLEVKDTLEIPVADGIVTVTGEVRCGIDPTLVIDLDASGAIAGDEFSLIQCGQLIGTFPQVQFPVAPAGHMWTLLYSSTELRVRLDAVEQAQLDLTAGTNGQQFPFLDGISPMGTKAIEFTILGIDPVELCTVTVDSVTTQDPQNIVGVRLFRASDQQLLASAEESLPQMSTPSDRLYSLNAVLQPGVAYRLAFYAEGSIEFPAYVPDLRFPYAQSTLLQIDGAFVTLAPSDEFPDVPHEHFPYMSLALGPCHPTAVGPGSPAAYKLALSSHPNPFNPSTTVSFDLPRQGRVKVDVFDARGRHIADLVDENRSAGRHAVPWRGIDSRGRTLGSGVYFVRLSHPSGNRVERVTLIK